MERIRVYSYSKNKESSEIIQQFIQKHPHIRHLDHAFSRTQTLEEITKFYPDVVIIDDNIGNENLTSIVHQILLTSPYVGIIILVSEHSSSQFKSYMNVGARDLLLKPYTSSDLAHSISTVYKHIQELKSSITENSATILTKSSKMITVFSTKGGVGKSVISTLLTTGLASHFREETVIIDLDLQFGDVSLLLDLKPKKTISNIIDQVDKISGEELRKMLTKHEKGMYVLPSPQNPEEEEFITEEGLTKVFKLLKQEFDFVIVDSPPGFTNQAIVALEQSDTIFFITSPEIIALKNTKNGLNTFKQLEISMDKVHLLVNRYSPRSKISTSKIEQILSQRVHATISDDYEHVTEFLNLGDPSIIYDSKTKINKELKQIINNLRAFYTFPQKKRKTWKNVFSIKKFLNRS